MSKKSDQYDWKSLFRLAVQILTQKKYPKSIGLSIVIKKIFYRAESFKVRDIFDLAVVIKNKEDALMENIDIFRSKLDLLNSRLDIIKKVYKKEIAALDIIDHETAKDALSIVHGFIKKGLNP